MTAQNIKAMAEKEYPDNNLIIDYPCSINVSIGKRNAYIKGATDAMNQWVSVETLLRTRIAELNKADAEFCEKRWDMNEHPLVRTEMRNQSNNVTFARQELEAILQQLGLPRFANDPIA